MKNKTKRNVPCLTPEDWIARHIEPADNLLGELLSTTSRILFSADTGLGKTMLAMGWAFGIALGRGFLHWRSRRKGRVLYIDGEMPKDLLQERIALACKWYEIDPREARRIFVLSTEDYEDMPPLDTPEGQAWLDAFIERIGGVDFIVFDNIMSLCAATMKEEDSWQNIKAYVLSLSRRRIGQLWLHHTGHNTTRAYGTKTREWQMDTVIVAEKVANDHIGINLKFTKARRCKPTNEADFGNVYVEYREEKWVGAPARQGPVGRPNKSEEVALTALRKAMADVGGPTPKSLWGKHADELGISTSRNTDSRRAAFRRAVDALVDSGKVSNSHGRYSIVE
jgi:hypothetical protein